MGSMLAISLLLAGCGSRTSGGVLDITENGTYDVSGYDQVVVHVGEGDRSQEVIVEDPVPEVQDLGLTRVQFSGFSMEIPAVMVEGYTEAELTENDSFSFTMNEGTADISTLSILFYDTQGFFSDLSIYNDAPIEDVNGINMAIRHSHFGDGRSIDVDFLYNDRLYSLDLSYPVSQDALFADYADGFYRSIEMN